MRRIPKEVLTWFWCSLFCCCGQLVADRPNILFIFSDDHAIQAISAYGGRLQNVAPTPNLDRIAAEGALFVNSFCTNSICAPSRAVVLTGKHSHVNGKIANSIRNPFDGSQTTFPKLLQASGYQTAMIGKWHLVSDPTGFDHWDILPGQGAYYNPDFRSPEGKRRVEGYTTDLITDLSLAWLEERDTSKPFLLMCQHKAPHRAWMPGPAHLNAFDDVEIPEPETLFDQYEHRASGAAAQEMSIAHHLRLFEDLKVTLPLQRDDKLPGMFGRLNSAQRADWDEAYAAENHAFLRQNLRGKPLVQWMYQRYLKDYLRCVRSVDDSVGRLLDYLDQHDLAENTIVIYSSDQGFYLGEHGWYDKRWMYEESLRMPLLMRWPGKIAPGTNVKELVQNLDYAPTLLDAGGLEPPAEMQGRSVMPLVTGDKAVDWRDSLYYHYYEYPAPHRVPPHYGVRTTQHKLIYYYETDEWELFDLKADPHEMHSVYGDAAYEADRQRLTAELIRLREAYSDTTAPAFD